MACATPEEAALAGFPPGEVRGVGVPARAPEQLGAVVVYEVLPGGYHEASVCAHAAEAIVENDDGEARFPVADGVYVAARWNVPAADCRSLGDALARPERMRFS